MGYLYLLISLLAGTTKGFLGKKISTRISGLGYAAAANVLRMILCCGISLLLMATGWESQGFFIDLSGTVICILSGLFLSTFTIAWLFSVQHGAFVLVSVAQIFGVIITLICNAAVFHISPSIMQYLGILVLLAAVLTTGSYSIQLKGKLSTKGIFCIVLCALSSGLYDFSLKLFTHFSSGSKSMMNLLTYAISALLLSCLVFFLKRKAEESRFDLKTILPAIILMSICLFLNSYFKAFATLHLDASQLYPIYQAGGLILSAIMSAVFFHERISIRCWIGMVLAFVSIMMLK